MKELVLNPPMYEAETNYVNEGDILMLTGKGRSDLFTFKEVLEIVQVAEKACREHEIQDYESSARELIIEAESEVDAARADKHMVEGELAYIETKYNALLQAITSST